MTEHLKPLDPDVAAALAAERGRPGCPPGVRERAFARLLAAVDGGGGGDPDPNGSSGAGEAPDLSPPDLESISPGGAVASIASTAGAALRAHPFVTGGIGFLCGLVSGVALHARLMAPGPSSPAVVPEMATMVVVSPVAEAPSAAPTPAPSSQSVSPASPEKPREAPASAPSSGADATAERALLDVARAARGRGAPEAALDALNQHQKRYAWGVFREEREALAIQSLRDLGRLDEAQRRARAFRARYPKSLFLTSVERVFESNP